MSMRVSIQQCLIYLMVLGAMMPALSRAEIDFFQTPAEQKRSNHERIIGSHSRDQDGQGLILHRAGM